ncbi:MAG: ABC transporter ATP-binding protein [Alphaproteobacteria bacterium]|nr:ABC transporter ATP-binding protein [Alphaproteobacteria bacterium]
MIEVVDLIYEYPTKRALHGVSLTISGASITALVGPNGAGKTTLLRCLAALEMPYSGKVVIDGLDTREHPRKIHERLGYLPDFFGLYDELTVAQCLTYAARSHGIPPSSTSGAVAKAAKRVSLSDRMESRAGELSRGLRQRLAIGQAIVHEPRVLLLDEPAAGLDPQARRDLSQLLLDLKALGLTLIVSSHILAELQDYSDQMVIIDDGRIAGGKAVSVGAGTAPLMRVMLAGEDGRLGGFLSAQEGVGNVTPSADRAVFSFSGGAQERARLLSALIGAGFAVIEFAETKRSLEETYFDEVNKARRP